jgi:membrane-associated protease RseP (regulator of RpoE activity)
MNPKFFESVVNQRDLRVLTMCSPVVVGILSLHVLQEVVHYLVAKKRGIKLGLPVPIPCTQLGLFGSITPLREFPPSRQALFDFALSGSVATFVASLACVVSGILGTVRASATAISHFPVLTAAKLKASFLIGTLLSWLAPKTMMVPLAQPIPIHPLFVIGYSGLIASALNLLPIFRLDGGRACSASLGPRQGSLVSISTLLFTLSLTVSGNNTGLGFLWIMVVTILQRQTEIQARDDVTELDDVRIRAWLCSFAMAILALAPFPSRGPGVL